MKRLGRRQTEDGRRTRAILFSALVSAATLNASEIVLPNGARVVVEERPASETVAVRLLVSGGQLDEPDGRHGVADLHAAMLLRGTRDRTGFALARAAEELGGRLGSWARPAAESVAIEVPAANVEPAIRLVWETFSSPRFDPGDLVKEKRLLSGSLATARDDPKTLLDDAFYRTLFPAHPLSRLASLTDAEVRVVGIEDVRAFHRSRLDSRRIALVVVGRCSSARIESLGRDLLGTLPTAAAPGSAMLRPALPAPSPVSGDVRRRVSHHTTQPTIVIGLPTAGISDGERPAFLLLRHVLAGFDERLYTEIREKRGYAYWIRAEGLELSMAGAFGVSTGAKEKFFGEIERIIRQELATIAAQPVAAEELERAVRFVRTAEAREDETNAGRISVIANDLADGAAVRTYEERVARLAAVTPEQIQQLARRLFEGKRLAVVTLY